jgi:hypothetical protein
MASTSNTATRRVLSPLNVNSPVSRNISTLKGAEGIEIRRQGKAIECTNSITGKDKNPAPNCQQATISSDNCNLDDAEGGDERPRKRVRIESEANPAQQLTGTLDCTPLNSEGSTAGHVEDQEPVRTAVDEVRNFKEGNYNPTILTSYNRHLKYAMHALHLHLFRRPLHLALVVLASTIHRTLL